MGLICWGFAKLKPKEAALAGRAGFDADTSAHPFRALADDGQADTGAFPFVAVETFEYPEDFFVVFGRNADAIVLQGNSYPVAGLFRLEGYDGRNAFGYKLEGIAEKIGEDLA